MPTNDERREVAEILRSGVGTTDYLSDDDFIDWVHGVVSRSRDGHILDRLADFIEPEERTCRNTVGKPFAGYRMFSCSECGAYLEVDGDTDANLFAGGERPMPRYCPNCGAKVVQE